MIQFGSTVNLSWIGLIIEIISNLESVAVEEVN